VSAARPLLRVEGLRLAFGATVAVDGLDFAVGRGETLALVGESGSGKSATALAILGLIEREGGRIADGRILLEDPDEIDLARLGDREMRAVRGRRIAMIFQEPMTSLNPVMTIGQQIIETIRLHEPLDAQGARARALEALDRVRIPDPARRLAQYPHELSGGLRQRVMIAMALACRPALLIADEPTTALDVTTQGSILRLIRDIQAEMGMAVLFITHDMAVVGEIADRVVVLRRGAKVEEAPTARLFAAPRHPYTRKLMVAAPRLGSGGPVALADPAPVLRVRDLVTVYRGRRPHPFAPAQEHRAVDGVSLEIGAGETLGLVGESGCGKSTLARSILRLVPVRSGCIEVAGQDVTTLPARRLFAMRRAVQMIFQDPFAALNPRLPAWDLVSEPAAIHGLAADRDARRALARSLLERVSLGPEHLGRYPHQFSGGQRQRLCIARALSVEPRLIIADEPVAALDVSIAKQVTDLMAELQRTLGLSFLFISHDVAVIERVSHRVAVMHRGRIVEAGYRQGVLENPRHPYTRSLIAAVPRPPRGFPAHTGSSAKAPALATVGVA
jgi:peptide/nickel transport system ATP-binding protein/glutathione transport system ATP-binding protein